MHYVDNTVVNAVGCAPKDCKTHPIKSTKAFCSVQSLASLLSAGEYQMFFKLLALNPPRHVLINAWHIRLANALNCSVVRIVREGAMYKGFDGTMPRSPVLSRLLFLSGQDPREVPEGSQDEHGEEDHGPAPAGGVQPPGQRAGPDAPAAPLHGALSPSAPHDTERAGGEALHDATSLQQGKPGSSREVFSLFELAAHILSSQDWF